MKNHTTTTEARAPAAPTPRIIRDRQGLLDAPTVIDSEGWEGPTATALLEYVRTEIVRPLAIDVGLRGAAASQAEATGWETTWVSLTKPSLRTATSPWGVLRQAARRLKQDRPVLVVCASGMRSRTAAKHLRSLGFDAASVSDGMSAWQRAGGAVRH